jgi:rare lipoprotein A (peptidoglycan hydrolase)
MQLFRHRPARKTESERAPAHSARLRVAVLAAVALAAISLSAVPAQATTGGASAASGVAAAPVEEAEIAFGPSRLAGASWYGPGLYGRQTACGETLRASTIGVAHRNLPCGTMVKFIYRGHTVVAPVIDRGPYVKGRAWDLTAATSEALEFEGAGMIRYAVALEYARAGATR